MRELLITMLGDLSTRDYFIFRAECENCAREFKSRPVRFSKAGIEPKGSGKRIIYETMYAQEHEQARNSAVRDALAHLNRCPICKRIVCNYCFLICDDLDLCKSCAARLEEEGSPVLNYERDLLRHPNGAEQDGL